MGEGEGEGKTMNKIVGLVVAILALTSVHSVEAQQPAKVPRIGYLLPLSPASEAARTELLRQGLRDLGYIEGKNILIEYRYAEGKEDRLPTLAGELVQLKVDLLVAQGFTATRAAKQATTTIPIIIVTATDPVETGIVASLARPGGNITGVARLTRDLAGKRLELLKEVIPRLSPVGVLWDTNSKAAAIGLKEYEEVAHALKVQLHSLEVRGPNPDLEAAFQAGAKGRVKTLITITNPVLRRYAKPIADLAIKNRLPSVYEGSYYVEDGGLMSYSADDAENFKRLAIFVDKILKGAKPVNLPVEQPMKFELVINLKTAKQIGVTIPPNVLARADKVIK
jgi:putative ABC transport system substrate-binding protein